MQINKLWRSSNRMIACMIVFVCGLPGVRLSAQNGLQDLSQKSVIAAIMDGATYAADVLLDEKGMSRCDYNLLEGKWYPYEPAWHTGQVIFGLVRAYHVTGEQKFLDAARRAGEWWISLEIKDNPKLNGMLYASHGDYVDDYLVYSTVTDGSAGLFQLAHATGDQRFADVPTRAGYWMLERMYLPKQGMFYNVIDPKTGEVLKDSSPFFPELKNPGLDVVARPNNEGSLHLDMYRHTKDERNKDIFLAICNSLVEKQDSSGLWMRFMPNSIDGNYFHPRFNLWYAESLINGYELNGDVRYLNAAVRTLQFYTKYQKRDGTFYYRNYLDGGSNRDSVCGSAVAFAGMLWLRLQKLNPELGFNAHIEKSAKWVIRNRYPADHPDKNLAGAFFELRTRRKGGKLWLTMRDIATSFGLRFLADYVQATWPEDKNEG